MTLPKEDSDVEKGGNVDAPVLPEAGGGCCHDPNASEAVTPCGSTWRQKFRDGYKSAYSKNAAYSVLSANAFLGFLGCNILLTLVGFNSLLSIASVNCALSVLSCNSFASILSVNSAFAIGCNGQSFAVCVPVGS